MNENEMVCYNTDGSGLIGNARKVVFPKNINHLIKTIKETKIDIVPRGGGTNIVGACIPNDSLVINMKKMKRVFNFDPITKTIQTEIGVTIKELNEKLKSINFEFPIYSNSESTIGGMIAINDIGYFGRYGNMKNWVEEIEFVTSVGELIKIGKVDISDVCGMEGTTGVIAKAKLKVIPLQKRTASVYQSNEIEEILAIGKRLNLEREIAMLRFYSKKASKLLGFPEKYHLVIVFNSDRGKIKHNTFNNLLNTIKNDYLIMSSNGYKESEDAVFNSDRLEDFILQINNLEIPYFGDFCSNITFTFFKNNNEKKEEVEKIIRKLQGKPGKYGIGLKRKNLLDHLQKKIFGRVKKRYDPFLKMNKGKLIDINESEEEENAIMKSSKESANLSAYYPKKGEQLIDKQIDDYENTFRPEIVDKKRNQIEKFAKEIPREMIKKDYSEIGKATMTDNLERESKKISESERDLINKIIFNKLEGKEDKEEKVGRNESRRA